MGYDKTKTFDKAEKKLRRTDSEEAFDNYWRDRFEDRVETLYVIMDDGTPFKYTSNDSEVIDLSAGALDMWLRQVKGKDYSLKNVKLIMHNHLLSTKFTDRDLKEHRRLKKFGFKGHFMIYSHMTKQIYEDKINGKHENDNQ